MPRLLQANLNHSRRAQDLWVQTMRELGSGLAFAAEPYCVPDRSNWVGDLSGLVAMTWAWSPESPPCSVLLRGRGFVAIEWLGIAVVGCYVSPNCGLLNFGGYLDEVSQCVATLAPRPMIVLGDFNAHAQAWGSPRTTRRGEALLEWAAGHDLRLINRGAVNTCVRWQGASIVDLTWATASAARRVSDWRVAEEVETLSDHLLISMNVASGPVSGSAAPSARRRTAVSRPPPRWKLARMDQDALMAAAEVVAWGDTQWRPLEGGRTAEEEAVRLRGDMTTVCDVAMPRAKPSSPRPGAVYWWSGQIAHLRDACVTARRRYTRARRRRTRGPAEAAALYEGYREAKVALQRAIMDAKAQAWKELLSTIDGDPWGRPYKIVREKLRAWAPPITESLDPQVLGRVVDNLFPACREGTRLRPTPPATPWVWSGDLGVTVEELARSVERMRARNTAPGPDGIPGRAWALASGVLGDRLRGLFDDCLREGAFPSIWRRARMVLLRKEGRPAESPSAYRPICLLDEAGKLFERVLAARLSGHLTGVGPDLSDSQFGFRQGRSTVDAVMRVRSLSESAVARGGVAIAVSLDIVNAFNTLPWETVVAALRHHGVPHYLRAVVGAYLSGRRIEYPGRYEMQGREIHRGVPQGSVLGPILWDLAYDAVLRAPRPAGVDVVCYADDTIIIAGGTGWRRAIRLAELGVACVVAAIRELGLEVAPAKTEALWFYDRVRRGDPPADSRIRVGETYVQVSETMRYLGLTLDSRWRFEVHFDRLAPRVERAAAALGRLLPNLGGPCEGVRRLYLGVARSMALYGSAVWAGDMMARRRSREWLRRLHRRLAIRIVRGYRTISHEAATVLAGIPPFEILAETSRTCYVRLKALREDGGTPSGEAVEAVKRQARRSAYDEWRRRLLDTGGANQRAVSGVLPSFKDWMGRARGSLTYRMTQVFTGHGCFGEYLRRIGKEATTQCHHCGSDRDTAQHTLEDCPAWAGVRRVLVAQIGGDLSLPAVVRAMLGSERSWEAVASFCEQVMSQKEEAERVREREEHPGRVGRPRGGARRRRRLSPPPQ